jgi:poly(A) polymerase
MKMPLEALGARAGMSALLEALGANAGEVRPIGGFVRDTLLDLHPSDVDLATIHMPEDAAARIRAAGFKVVPTGIAHGTVTAVLPSGPVEVTTLRRDVETDGRHAVVAFTDDWQADAARRDFTINALSADPRDGSVFDYFGGEEDLAAGRVRFIGDPLARIAEDHLRILRFFRFHARFGKGAPSPADVDACAARANDLMALSRERIAQELIKLLSLPDPAPTIAIMFQRGIFTPILPEIAESGVARLAALVDREAGDGDPIRRLAAMLPADAAVADKVGARLKFSKAQRKRLITAAEPAMEEARALAYRIGLMGARDRLLLAGDVAGLAAIDGWTPPRLPVGGGVLVTMGLSAGPQVAAGLIAIERRWIAEGFPDVTRVEQLAREEVARALG